MMYTTACATCHVYQQTDSEYKQLGEGTNTPIASVSQSVSHNRRSLYHQQVCMMMEVNEIDVECGGIMFMTVLLL